MLTQSEQVDNAAIRAAIQDLSSGENLSEQAAAAAMDNVMEGAATPAQIAAFITALRMKGETVDEITGCARAMRARAYSIHPEVDTLVDTCGTGGDGANTFNISTTTAFVVAGAGLPVAKHGNRSVSSRCGSADVLEALGIGITLTPAQVSECIKQAGIGFLFAPVFHSAMKHAVGPRRELGIRTIFNVLGPLTNPANANVQVLGVYDARLTLPLAQVLGRLGIREAFVVHGLDRIDELSISGPTEVAHLKNGEVRHMCIAPGDVGLPESTRDAITGGDAQTNARITLDVLRGAAGPHRNVVLINAAAALFVSGAVASLREGVRLAESVIDQGRALQVLQRLRDFTTACAIA